MPSSVPFLVTDAREYPSGHCRTKIMIPRILGKPTDTTINMKGNCHSGRREARGLARGMCRTPLAIRIRISRVLRRVAAMSIGPSTKMQSQSATLPTRFIWSNDPTCVRCLSVDRRAQGTDRQARGQQAYGEKGWSGTRSRRGRGRDCKRADGKHREDRQELLAWLRPFRCDRYSLASSSSLLSQNGLPDGEGKAAASATGGETGASEKQC